MYRTVVAVIGVIFCLFLLPGLSHATLQPSISLTFNNNSQMTLADKPSNSDVFMEQPLVITNNTSTTWTDFHLSVSLAGLGDPVFFEYPGTTFPDAYVGPGAAVFTGPYGGTPAAPFFATGPVDITGISIASGDTYSFTIGFGHGEQIGDEILSGYPTTNGGGGTTVPEPATMLLLGLGLVGLAGVRRKFQK